MRIVFLSGGARDKTLRFLLERRENIVAVMTPFLSDKNRRFERVITTAAEFGIPILPVQRDTITISIKKISFDLLLSCGFPFHLPKEAVEAGKYAINVHPTLLPKYRGYRSGPYVILNGEKKTGVTVHFLTEELDKGDILAQREIPLSVFDTMKSIYRKLHEVEPQLVYDVVQRIKKGETRAMPQDESQATCFPKNRVPDDSWIDWNKPLRELYNEIRACDPEDYPAFFFVEGQKVCIRLWRPDKKDDEGDML